MQTPTRGRKQVMGRHRKWDDDHKPGWPDEDPDEEERTVRNMPKIPNPEPIKNPTKED
jgi:hypothetical protein